LGKKEEVLADCWPAMGAGQKVCERSHGESLTKKRKKTVANSGRIHLGRKGCARNFNEDKTRVPSNTGTPIEM